MDEQLRIRVSIGDRMYPLKINPEREEGIRSAVKKIEELSQEFEKGYAVKDKQDVLAMCALHFASNIEQKDVQSNEEYEQAKVLLEKMIQQTDYLK